MIVGLDMGGTHIDGVVIKDKRIVKRVKNPTDREDLFDSIWSSLKELLEGLDKDEIRRINLSTTVSTNAIVEDKTSKVGMVVQSGPGVNNDFSDCKGGIHLISGYVDHRGETVEELDMDQVREVVKSFKDSGIETLAAVSKFSNRNPETEIEIAQNFKDDFETVTLGHRMSGSLNFPRRVFTSYLNSAVHSTFKNFAENIKKSLEREGVDAPMYILKADGGTMDIGTAQKRPVETILSGPAASFMGISSMVGGEEDAILLDIGGTTTDIFFLADGVQLFEPAGARISQFNTLVRSIYSKSIGLGGDSRIRVEDDKLKIGPRREGRPAAFGGPSPTPTDAMICLGLIEVSEDQSSRAEGAIGLVAKELSTSIQETSNTILKEMARIIKNTTDSLLEEINREPVYTVKELLEDKRIEPKNISVIGGPANVLAPFLEARYGLDTYYPRDYEVANAIGAALAKPTVQITMLADTAQGILRVSDLGVYEKISKSYTLEDAKERSRELLEGAVKDMGAKDENIETEIIEASSFNMVGGFFTTGKNIRIEAQIKPGHVLELRSGREDES